MAEFLPPDYAFTADGKPAVLHGRNRTAVDFWRWSYSDLMENTTRGIVAQYIVAWAIGVDGSRHDPWRSYDLLSKEGKRVEVKATGFLQAWDYGAAGRKPLFVLAPKLQWSKETGLAKEPTWNADIYVLCYFYWTDLKTADIMNLDQWKFWVFGKDELVKVLDGRQSLTVSFLEKNNYRPFNAFQLMEAVASADKTKHGETKPKARPAGSLDEKSFFDTALKNLDKEELNGLWQIYNYCSRNGEIMWRTTSFSAVFPEILDRSLFSAYANGDLQVYYGYLDNVRKKSFVAELYRIKEIKPRLSESKGSPMCREPAWLKSATSFIQAI
ncbi:MAG TPA: hypothetical protein VJP79_08220, partial [Nitrososphaera sp.]|nr:hypothetical protein [Nitrososphaera sp.]